jgi:hypothetical protein
MDGLTLMNIHTYTELPPVDFVAFLAERGGLSQEAAETCLERWFGEYHATSGGRDVASGRGQVPTHAR